MYSTWKKFKHHVTRCQPANKARWPKCHFCNKHIPAVGRPYEMDRHLCGKGEKLPCPELKRMMEEGKDTNGAIGDWLRGKSLPIETEFLGERLAEALYRAAFQRVGRGKKVDLQRD